MTTQDPRITYTTQHAERPSCPQCPGVALWRDTSATRPGMEDAWYWWCVSCRHAYRPTDDHRRTYGVPAGSADTV
jgi:hypothetical protein